MAGRASSSVRYTPSATDTSAPVAFASLRRSVDIWIDGSNPAAVRRTHTSRNRRYASSAGTRAASPFACPDSAFTGSAPASANSRNTACSRSSSTASPCSPSASRARRNICAANPGFSTSRKTRPARSKKVGRKCGTESASRAAICWYEASATFGLVFACRATFSSSGMRPSA